MSKIYLETNVTEEMVYNYIKYYVLEHGYAPSVREIGIGVGLSSTSSVHYHITNLLNKGLLETDIEKKNCARAFRVSGLSIIEG